jgi:hypothetical protein
LDYVKSAIETGKASVKKSEDKAPDTKPAVKIEAKAEALKPKAAASDKPAPETEAKPKTAEKE